MNVTHAAILLASALASFITKNVTVRKKPHESSMNKPSSQGLASFSSSKFILEKSLRLAGNALLVL